MDDVTATTLEPTTDPGMGIGNAPNPAAVLGTPPADPPPVPEPKPEPAPKAKAAPTPQPLATPPKAAPTVAAPAAEPKPGEPPPIPAPANWPEDWRQKIAGDDKKEIDRLARFGSPEDIFKSLRELERKLSSGQYAKRLPTHYTEQELAEYRKANGIPDKPEDYDTDIGGGIVWGEEDKPLIEDFTKFAHENHAPPEFVKMGLEWWARQQETLENRLEEQDQINYQAGADELRAEWGAEMKANINAIKNMLEGTPGAWDFIMGARDETGRRNGDNPVVLKGLGAVARELNPYGSLVPSSGTDAGATVQARMAEIQSLMGNKMSAYWRGPQSAALQEEYRRLIDMNERAKQTGRAA